MRTSGSKREIEQIEVSLNEETVGYGVFSYKALINKFEDADVSLKGLK